jgi:hypothetical protein
MQTTANTIFVIPHAALIEKISSFPNTESISIANKIVSM